MSQPNWKAVLDEALPYHAFLDQYATPAQRSRWDASHARVRLDPAQRALLAGFTRQMPILVLNGAWCGDCIQQCPILEQIAAACPRITLRFLDRDARTDVQAALAINGGSRVPAVLFLSEDHAEVARYGDRPLATYRRLARTQLGPACPTGLAEPPADETAACIQEWLEQVERAQLILRLSPRLRELHGD